MKPHRMKKLTISCFIIPSIDFFDLLPLCIKSVEVCPEVAVLGVACSTVGSRHAHQGVGIQTV